jgi:hypothetical protein
MAFGFWNSNSTAIDYQGGWFDQTPQMWFKETPRVQFANLLERARYFLSLVGRFYDDVFVAPTVRRLRALALVIFRRRTPQERGHVGWIHKTERRPLRSRTRV